MSAYGYAACGVILAGCAAYAISVLRDRRRPAPGLPASGRIPLTDEEVMEKFLITVLKWHETATEPEQPA